MSAPHLSAVPNDRAASPSALAEIYDLGRGVESGAQRVRRLQNEARILVRDLNALAVRAAELAEGGDAYPAGVRELASRLAADLPLKAEGMATLMARTVGR